MSGTSTLHVQQQGPVAEIVLDRPPVNALNWALKRQLKETLDRIAVDAGARTVVISSASARHFCAGSDLHELIADHDKPGSALQRTLFEYELWESTLSALPQPSIAVVEGYALGSGTELAIACDFRVAGEDATLGLPEIRIGGAPGIQSIARLVAMVGLTAARRMLLLGQPLSAAEAHAIGLVDYVVAPGTARERALELAEQLADQPRSSVVFIKEALARTVQPAMRGVEEFQTRRVAELFDASEMHEGISAFLERRPADFRNLERSPKQ